MDLQRFGVVSQVELDNLNTKERVIDAYVKIATTAKKPGDRLRALDKIAEMRGFKIEIREVGDFRNMSPELLQKYIQNVLLPTLVPYDVDGVMRPIEDDVPLDN